MGLLCFRMLSNDCQNAKDKVHKESFLDIRNDVKEKIQLAMYLLYSLFITQSTFRREMEHRMRVRRYIFTTGVGTSENGCISV